MPGDGLAAGRRAVLSLLIAWAAGMPAARAGTLDDALLALQRDWEVVRYQTPALERGRRYEALAARARQLADESPGRSEALVWEGTILSSWAEDSGGITALRLLRRAKGRYEAALRIDPRALDGMALNALGMLYVRAPGWPFGFGDAEKARALLSQGLQIDPDGIDSNTCWGEFLTLTGHPDEAVAYLEKAIARPARPGHLVGDTGRREEARALLAKLRAPH